jgi:hypothetical protein
MDEYIKYIFCIHYSNGCIRFRCDRTQTGTYSYLKAEIKSKKLMKNIKNDCKNRNIDLSGKNIDKYLKIGDLYIIILPEDYSEILNLPYYDIGNDMKPIDMYKHSRMSEELSYNINIYLQQLYNYYKYMYPNYINMNPNYINMNPNYINMNYIGYPEYYY